jgi:transcriptional regulator GlxA family with amidase domain
MLMKQRDFRVSVVLKHIDENLGDPSLSLRSVSTVAGISTWHMSRVFKREVGTGFREYLLTLRLSKATELLTSSTMSIKEIATRAGFRYSSDLNRNLRRSTGSAPSVVRSAARRRGPDSNQI